MPLNHSLASVTISLDGLLLSCINRCKEFEIGVLSHHDHALSLDVIKTTPTGLQLLNHGLDLANDIQIELTDPSKPGASRYTSESPIRFNRRLGMGDAEDFRWIADLEAGDMHGDHIHVKEAPARRIYITDGKFYTMKKTDRNFLRRNYIRPPEDDEFYGRLADITGADIQFTSTSSVTSNLVLSDGTRNFSLGYEAQTKYFIIIKNVRVPGSMPMPMGSDFLMFYEHVEDYRGHIFDLEELQNSVDLLSKPPQNCDGVHLGFKDTLDPDRDTTGERRLVHG